MDCREFEKKLPELFDQGSGPLPGDMKEHLETCANCSRFLNRWQATVGKITPSVRIEPASDLKQRIMKHSAESTMHSEGFTVRFALLRTNWRRLSVAASLALLAVVLFSSFYPDFLSHENNGKNDPQQFLNLVSEAMAAQWEFTYPDGVSYLAVEHVLPSVEDSDVARSRWYSMHHLLPDGIVQNNRVMMSAKPNQPYTVKQELWFDNDSGRFLYSNSFDGEILFATCYDGNNISTLSIDNKDSVVCMPVKPGFTVPEMLPQKLGMLSNWDDLMASYNAEQNPNVSLKGQETLQTGETVNVLEYKGLPMQDGTVNHAHYFKIRTSNNTVAQIVFEAYGKPSKITRYQSPLKVDPEEVTWNLQGLNTVPDSIREIYGLSLEMDVIRENISLQEALELCEFPICDFDTNPAWTDSANITFLRMFFSLRSDLIIVYPAKPGGKHVYLSQVYYWQRIAEKNMVPGPLHVAPTGFKLYSLGDKSQWYANIAFTASAKIHKDQPSEDRMSYLVETPAGTWCNLSINGTLSDSNLFDLVDKLVMLEKEPRNADTNQSTPLL